MPVAPSLARSDSSAGPVGWPACRASSIRPPSSTWTTALDRALTGVELRDRDRASIWLTICSTMLGTLDPTGPVGADVAGGSPERAAATSEETNSRILARRRMVYLPDPTL